MKKTTTILTAIFTLLVVSCEKTPMSCIELSAESIAAGSALEFTSCSENALSYEWFIEGPDGAPENDLGWSDIKFSRAFSVPGSYEVTLHAYEDFSFAGEFSTTNASFVVN